MKITSKMQNAYLNFCIFFLLILTCGTLDLLREGGARHQGVNSIVQYDGPLNKLPLLWIILVALFFFAKATNPHFIKRIKFDKTALLLIIYIFLSITWSKNKHIALRDSVFISFSYLTIHLQSIHTTQNIRLRTLCTLLLIMQIASVLTATLIPSYGISVGEHEGRWQGIFNHKNILGNFSALAYAISLGSLYVKKTKTSLIGSVISLLLIILSQSSTALASALAISILGVVFTSKIAMQKSLLHQKKILTLLIMLSLAAVYATAYQFSLNIIGKDSSFSGRSIIWATLIGEIVKHPILGHGLSQFQTIFFNSSTTLQHTLSETASSSHNGFIDAMFSLGITGTIIFIAMLFQALTKSKIDPLFPLKIFTLTTIIITNTFESALISFNTFLVIIFFILELGNQKIQAQQKTPIPHTQ